MTELGGSASFLDISKHVWVHYEDEIRAMDDLLYEWQYELRWAAYFLRRKGYLRARRTLQEEFGNLHKQFHYPRMAISAF